MAADLQDHSIVVNLLCAAERINVAMKICSLFEYFVSPVSTKELWLYILALSFSNHKVGKLYTTQPGRTILQDPTRPCLSSAISQSQH